ncbi:MAG TPA: DUF1631 family protein, partial [Pseudomonadales bacterium]|nr:DUF1631 family protein [Pseudomonadales bacterium]
MPEVPLDSAQIDDTLHAKVAGIAELAQAGVGDTLNLAREEHLAQARMILERLPEGEARDRLREAVCMVATLFKMLARESLLTTEALMLINRMQLPLVRIFISDAAMLGNPRHPARLLLQELCAALLGVSTEIGAGADVIYEPVRDVILLLEQSEVLDDETLQGALVRLREELATLNRRIERIEDKVRQSEQGRERTEVAQREVTRALNQRLQGVSLPPSVTRFLHGPWRDSLKLVWVRNGADSKAWSQGVQLTDFLLWALQPGNAEVDPQRFYNGMPLLIKGLTVGLISLSHDPVALERALSEVNDELLKILKKEPCHCEPAQLIPDDSLSDEATTAELSSALAQIDGLKPGDWILLKQDTGEIQHCKIAVVSRQTQRYILVNRMGMRIAEKSRTELAVALYKQKVRILGAASLFERVLGQTMASLHDAFVMQEKRRALERVQQEEKKRQLEAELKAQALAQELALARQQAEEKERQRLAEEDRLAREQAAEAAKLLLQQESEAAGEQAPAVESLALDFDAEEAANNLNVGGWIELF